MNHGISIPVSELPSMNDDEGEVPFVETNYGREGTDDAVGHVSVVYTVDYGIDDTEATSAEKDAQTDDSGIYNTADAADDGSIYNTQY